MRLLELNNAGEFGLTESLLGSDILPGAILSHTWGPDAEEVTFEDLIDGTRKSKAGALHWLTGGGEEIKAYVGEWYQGTR